MHVCVCVNMYMYMHTYVHARLIARGCAFARRTNIRYAKEAYIIDLFPQKSPARKESQYQVHILFVYILYISFSAKRAPPARESRASPTASRALRLHEQLLGIQRVSTPSTENQRMSTPAHSILVRIGLSVSSESMVHIKPQKGVYGVENPPSRRFLGGVGLLNEQVGPYSLLQGQPYLPVRVGLSKLPHPRKGRSTTCCYGPGKSSRACRGGCTHD